jgi:hypothetical protein
MHLPILPIAARRLSFGVRFSPSVPGVIGIGTDVSSHKLPLLLIGERLFF